MPVEDELLRAAEVIDEVVGTLEPAMADLAAFHRPDVWTGARADRFGRELEDRARQVRATADDLRLEAARLRARVTALPVPVRAVPLA